MTAPKKPKKAFELSAEEKKHLQPLDIELLKDPDVQKGFMQAKEAAKKRKNG